MSLLGRLLIREEPKERKTNMSDWKIVICVLGAVISLSCLAGIVYLQQNKTSTTLSKGSINKPLNKPFVALSASHIRQIKKAIAGGALKEGRTITLIGD